MDLRFGSGSASNRFITGHVPEKLITAALYLRVLLTVDYNYLVRL